MIISLKAGQDSALAAQNSLLPDSSGVIDTAEAPYATYYVVIADTGFRYSHLRTRMVALSKQLNVSIDTMGRYFNSQKDLIIVPANVEDGIYAGDYFPRLLPSQSLSIEYLSLYQPHSTAKTMALVRGIYETEQSADSALMVLHRVAERSFKIKSSLYAGCLH